MERFKIRDTALHITGTVLGWNGREATVQWNHKSLYVTGVTKQQLESGRYRLEGKAS